MELSERFSAIIHASCGFIKLIFAMQTNQIFFRMTYVRLVRANNTGYLLARFYIKNKKPIVYGRPWVRQYPLSRKN